MVMVPLSGDEISRRARKMRLVVTDCDGVLTDAGVYYSAAGEVMKRFCLRDGMGVSRLREAGVETGIMTGETSASIVKRAEKLAITKVWLGVQRKGEALALALRAGGYEASEVGYIGDDYNDLDAIGLIAPHGLTGAPRDAMPAVLAEVHHRSEIAGGHGAFRDFAEWILLARRLGPPLP
jgi:3-deoxy-D-manno-octulosonate 8-phosphate phosphatase (KDO 8-P phosphatase)